MNPSPPLTRTRSRALLGVAAATISLSLLGCAPTVAPKTAPPGAAPTAPPRTLPNDLHWVGNSAEYRAIALQTYRAATHRLEQLAAGRAPGSWAVSLDADETVISNFIYQKEIVAEKVPHSGERQAAFARRLESPPVPGVMPFLAAIHRLGGRIVIVTNRRQAICGETEANFRKYSIPFDLMLCVRDGESSQKEPRWDAVGAGTAALGWPPVEILLWVGDNIGDFPDLGQDARLDPAKLALFGDRYFALPNPMYGSWESNPEN